MGQVIQLRKRVISVPLTPKGDNALADLGFEEASAVNAALEMYATVMASLDAGRPVVISRMNTEQAQKAVISMLATYIQLGP